MKKFLIVAGALVTLGAAPQPAAAQAGGCIKYGLGGAILGKLAGGHTWKGAAAGCVVGYLRRRQARNEITQREREVLARHERQIEREQMARRDRPRDDRGYRDERAYRDDRGYRDDRPRADRGVRDGYRSEDPSDTGSLGRRYNGI